MPVIVFLLSNNFFHRDETDTYIKGKVHPRKNKIQSLHTYTHLVCHNPSLWMPQDPKFILLKHCSALFVEAKPDGLLPNPNLCLNLTKVWPQHFRNITFKTEPKETNSCNVKKYKLSICPWFAEQKVKSTLPAAVLAIVLRTGTTFRKGKITVAALCTCGCCHVDNNTFS